MDDHLLSQHSSNSGIPGIGITKVSAIISKEQIVSKHTHSIILHRNKYQSYFHHC